MVRVYVLDLPTKKETRTTANPTPTKEEREWKGKVLIYEKWIKDIVKLRNREKLHGW